MSSVTAAAPVSFLKSLIEIAGATVASWCWSFSALDNLLVADSGSLSLSGLLGLVISVVNLPLSLVLLVDMLGRKDVLVLDGLDGGMVVVLVDLVVDLSVNLLVLVGLDVLVHHRSVLLLVYCGVVVDLDCLVNSLVYSLIESLGLVGRLGNGLVDLGLLHIDVIVLEGHASDNVLDRGGELAEGVIREFGSHVDGNY
ncbi:hypothetical protein HG530_012430 [Fusarium avenaceum]|nr:hypothetical protein HG530_012430 [Fusarium avenaceum]